MNEEMPRAESLVGCDASIDSNEDDVLGSGARFQSLSDNGLIVKDESAACEADHIPTEEQFEQLNLRGNTPKFSKLNEHHKSRVLGQIVDTVMQVLSENSSDDLRGQLEQRLEKLLDSSIVNTNFTESVKSLSSGSRQRGRTAVAEVACQTDIE